VREGAIQVELRQYGDLLIRRWPIWVGLTVLALMFSTVWALLGPVAYEATLRMAVGTEPVPTSVGYYDPNYYAWLSSEYLADDLSEFLKSDTFAADVSQIMGYKVDPKQIADVTRTKKTHRMIDVTVSAPTPQEAQAIGDAYEKAVNEKLPQYFPQLRVQNAAVTVVNHPKADLAYGKAALAGIIVLRALVGLVLGLALAFLVDYLDASVRDRLDLERLGGLPVLAEIPAAR
jgi:capsular polysaccharide biosynthesis protein